ncbi:hypothetical protein OHJ21_05110 [Virgibacillus sp. LDC1]|nr:hypothetical protein [Virgibacillus sp. LDC1]
MSIPFRHSAGFGKRIEYYLIGLMLKEGIDVYVPLVDDNAIDAIIKKADGSYIEIQIKARSLDVKPGDAALFAAITHKDRNNYYFVFYIEEAVLDKSGKNIGKRSIKFNGSKTDKITKERIEYAKERYDKYLVNDFSKFY